MTPGEHDTDPAPSRETPADTTAPPLGPPPRLPEAYTPPRVKRATVSSVGRKVLGALGELVVLVAKAVGKHADKVVSAAMALAVALLLAWTQRIDAKADKADAVAGVAAAQGTAGAATAVKAKAEAAAGYDATKEKADESGKVIADLAARVAELTARIEKLEAAKAGRPRRRTPPVKVPVVVTEPLPATQAAAAKEAAAPSGGVP